MGHVPAAQLQGNLYVITDTARSEPLVGRILETPIDLVKSEDLDDPRSGYSAYVPMGSIARGRELATVGIGGGTAQRDRGGACVLCHGAELRGMGDAPPIAGRSPSYLVRQLYDFKTGARNGRLSALMQPVAARLTTSQMTDLAAYIASL